MTITKKAPKVPKTYAPLAEVAAELGLDESVVRRHIYKGYFKGKARRIKGRWYLRRGATPQYPERTYKQDEELRRYNREKKRESRARRNLSKAVKKEEGFKVIYL